MDNGLDVFESLPLQKECLNNIKEISFEAASFSTPVQKKQRLHNSGNLNRLGNQNLERSYESEMLKGENFMEVQEEAFRAYRLARSLGDQEQGNGRSRVEHRYEHRGEHRGELRGELQADELDDDHRGVYRGEHRGELHSDYRGEYRGEHRAEHRGEQRGHHHEQRGHHRGQPRGEYRDEHRGDYRGGHFDRGNSFSQRSEDYFIIQRLRNINGPTVELAPFEDEQEKKFSARSRLYVGNLADDIAKEDDLRKMFKLYGEVGDVYHNSEKNYAFVTIDYHANAVKAKRALDGSQVNGRQLRVRFAFNLSVLRVGNLTPFVSNELLHKSFEIFGPIERALIKVDARGNHLGEGIVEFTKKSSASNCLRLCQDKCYFLTASMRPCFVEPMEVLENNDGLPEKGLTKNNDYNQERSVGPHFADLDSFEHEYGTKWKQLHLLYNDKQASLKHWFKMKVETLENRQEIERSERQTQYLREELRKREDEIKHKKLQLWQEQEQQQLPSHEFSSGFRRQQVMHNERMRAEEQLRRRQQEMPCYTLDQPIARNGPFVVFPDKNKNSSNNGIHTLPDPLIQMMQDQYREFNGLINDDPMIRRQQVMHNERMRSEEQLRRRQQEMPCYTLDQPIADNGPFVVFPDENNSSSKNDVNTLPDPAIQVDGNPNLEIHNVNIEIGIAGNGISLFERRPI